MPNAYLTRGYHALLNLLYPPKCPFCRKLLDRQADLLCGGCQKTLPWLEEGAAKRTVDFTDGCWSPLAYRDKVPGAIQRFKFTPLRAYGRPLGILMAQCARDRLPGGADGVVWAPLSARRRRRRGFDQGRELAEVVARELGLPLLPALEKFRDNPPQSGLTDASARKANAMGVYRLGKGADVAGRRLILVDDVVTSGATLSACAAVLRQGGAENIWCLTLAQARQG